MSLAPVVSAAPSTTGQTGLIHMPDARIEPDGTWRLGISAADPYVSVWSSVTFFPRLELSGRYVTIDNVPGFSDPALGEYRDKAFDAKLLLHEESASLPAIVFGTQDYVGTQLFSARYLALSKRLGDVDLTIGAGHARIDGMFGGIRYSPAGGPWGFVAEYDANDYRKDYRADLSGADQRHGGMSYGVEYRYGWLGTQLAYQHGDWSGNVYVAIPLMQPEFVPKIDEPAALTPSSSSVALAAWRSDVSHARALIATLSAQGFSDVFLRIHGETLEIAVTHDRISSVGRAAGRALRIARRLGPSDVTAIRIIYTVNQQPLLSYEVVNFQALDAYLNGVREWRSVEDDVTVTYASTDEARALTAADVRLGDAEDDTRLQKNFAGEENRDWSEAFRLVPFNARIFFNDPGEPVRYDTFSALIVHQRVQHSLYLDAAARLTLFENVSDIHQASNSLLPHVRSDIGDYRREGDSLRLDSLLLNKYALLDERLYGRASVGYYEEMYAGAGGQLLYLSPFDWSADFALDWVRQRAPGEAFGFRDYDVATAIGSLHYRLPSLGVTTTLRAGRFLARDEGARIELKRRFRSGVELGVWYSVTNKEDTTGPGTPADPYHDKGLYVSIPLSSMLTADTKERATMALADFTRDVGQMVLSPSDLYRLYEQALYFGSPAHNPLTDFLE